LLGFVVNTSGVNNWIDCFQNDLLFNSFTHRLVTSQDKPWYYYSFMVFTRCQLLFNQLMFQWSPWLRLCPLHTKPFAVLRFFTACEPLLTPTQKWKQVLLLLISGKVWWRN